MCWLCKSVVLLRMSLADCERVCMWATCCLRGALAALSARCPWLSTKTVSPFRSGGVGIPIPVRLKHFLVSSEPLCPSAAVAVDA